MEGQEPILPVDGQDNQNGENAPQNREIKRVSVKLPPFWPSDSEIWFQQVEAQFQLGGILMDSTKFYTLLTAVDTKILAQVNNAVLNPPNADKYGNLKKAMLEQFAVSDQKKIKTLLEDIQLGDKKPSNLLNEMRILGGTKVSGDLLKQIWLQRLPSQIRMIVSTSGDEDLNNIAKMADKLMELGDFSQINATSTTSPSNFSNSSSTISALEAKIDALTKQVNQMQFNQRSRSKFRSSSNKRDSTPAGKKYDTCWWHFRFGDQAKRCKQPCNFDQSKN